jgi:light-regulated signal transduction histidine kinase (bacteriophytochrome)/CheY-like chemotaxis protein
VDESYRDGHDTPYIPLQITKPIMASLNHPGNISTDDICGWYNGEDEETKPTKQSVKGDDDHKVHDASSHAHDHSIHNDSSSHQGTTRVFPIRSVVSVDPLGRSLTGQQDLGMNKEVSSIGSERINSDCISETTESDIKNEVFTQSSTMASDGNHTLRDARHEIGPSACSGGSRLASFGPLPLFLNQSSPKEPESDPPPSTSISPLIDGPDDKPLVTNRFDHVIIEGGHAVYTGQHQNLQRCEDEPIHTPGAVQNFGLLVALSEDDQGNFHVRYVSENSTQLVGHTPQYLFGLHNFLDILTTEQQDNLLDHIDFIRDEDTDPTTNGPEVFSIIINPGGTLSDQNRFSLPEQHGIKYWCAIHRNKSHPDLVICEFEPEDDKRYPLYPPTDVHHDDGVTITAPIDTLHSNPTEAELHESTEMMSKPLRILRSARNRKGDAGAMQVFDIMSQVQEQLASAPNLPSFLKILVGIVKELTGFHRVMIYQFDASFNGKVVTELVDPSHTKDLYHGLHFPASDIPRQARDLYKINKVRILYDRDLVTSRLVCRSRSDLSTPLDLTHSYLRAMSPVHLKYLENMAVRSSMSISLNAFNELWGLISCHSYGASGMRVSFPIRKMCRLVGETASRNIERLSYASRLQARKLINTTPTDKNPSGYIIASSDDLLHLFDSDYGLLSIQGETKILGKVEQSQEALAMLEYLRIRRLSSVITSHDISADFPDLRYPPGFRTIAGVLYVPLSSGGSDFIVFFRHGQTKEVRWAGNPYEKVIRHGTSNYLEPRASFKAWHETVLGKCRDWTEEQVETAAVLCLVYGKFIEVWRQKQAALQSSRLTRLLLANSAHEVRTPLNAIINYLEIALEGSLDQETRENLAKSHSASKSLIYVINDLLDLTKAEEGQSLVKDEAFDLHACVREATDPFVVDARLKGIRYNVVEHAGLPRFVHGDSRHLRQAIANLTANAIAHTTHGSVTVEAYVSEAHHRKVRIEFTIQDTGSGMSSNQVDAIFQDLEQVTSDSEEFSSCHEDTAGKRRTLGLGLAVVARIVRNMDGQLRLRSREGHGSRFVVQLPFEATENEDREPEHLSTGRPSSNRPLSSPMPVKNVHYDGEITLVDRNSQSNSVACNDSSTSLRSGLDRMNSFSSLQSKGSKASAGSKNSNLSSQSNADRLINALQTPLSLVVEDHTRSEIGSISLLSHQNPQAVDVNIPNHNSFEPHSIPAGQSQLSAKLHTGLLGANDLKADSTADDRIHSTATLVKEPCRSTHETARDNVGQETRCEVLETVNRVGHKNQRLALPKQPILDFDQARPSHGPVEPPYLAVLVAEDDPINMKLLRKRLEKAGHSVGTAVNGQACAFLYRERSLIFDVILMDMQMPIVDGLASTVMIRDFEKTADFQGLSRMASLNGRIPIFAVSASLVEHDRPSYVEAGFDGWVLKPIDFKRLNELLSGIYNHKTRVSCLYTPGQWERGGWFSA